MPSRQIKLRQKWLHGWLNLKFCLVHPRVVVNLTKKARRKFSLWRLIRAKSRRGLLRLPRPRDITITPRFRVYDLEPWKIHAMECKRYVREFLQCSMVWVARYTIRFIWHWSSKLSRHIILRERRIIVKNCHSLKALAIMQTAIYHQISKGFYWARDILKHIAKAVNLFFITLLREIKTSDYNTINVVRLCCFEIW